MKENHMTTNPETLKAVVADIIAGDFVKAEQSIEQLLSIKTGSLISQEREAMSQSFMKDGE